MGLGSVRNESRYTKDQELAPSGSVYPQVYGRAHTRTNDARGIFVGTARHTRSNAPSGTALGVDTLDIGSDSLRIETRDIEGRLCKGD